MTTRPATTQDAAAVVEVFNACSLERAGKPELSEQEIVADWQMPGFDLTTDTQVVLTPDGQLIGYGDLWGNSATFVRFTAWVRVHPDYRGRGIGTFLNEWVAARARLELHRAPDGARVVLETHASAQDTPARQLLRTQGMTETRYSWQMEIDLDRHPPTPRWPAGIGVRNKSPGDERAIYEARRSAFRDHWGDTDEPFEEGFTRWRHLTENDPTYDPSLWFLVQEGDQIVGFAICTPGTAAEPDMAWVHSLGVRRAWRRRGIGLALLHHAFGEFFRRGIKRAGLSVDAQSLTGATRLYTGAGMRVTHEYVRYEKELRPGTDLRTRST